MKFLTATAPPWLRVVIALALFGAGFWTRGSIEARQELHEAKQEVRLGNEVDQTLAEKLRTEAEADAKLETVSRKHQEVARHDPSYREYLDSPLPPAAVQFLRDAESIPYGPDGTDPGSEAGR